MQIFFEKKGKYFYLYLFFNFEMYINSNILHSKLIKPLITFVNISLYIYKTYIYIQNIKFKYHSVFLLFAFVFISEDWKYIQIFYIKKLFYIKK